jgi:hypothetical protein
VTTQVLTSIEDHTASICCGFEPRRQHARTSGCSLLTILSPLGVAPTSARLPMLGKQVGLKIAHPATGWQRLYGAPWRETTSRGGARWRIEPMSGAASTPAQHQHQLRCHRSRTRRSTARGRGGVTHPRGSGDLRQRRHSSRVRPLPRVALWANQRSWEGLGHRGEPHRQQLLTNPAPSSIVTAPPVIPAS